MDSGRIGRPKGRLMRKKKGIRGRMLLNGFSAGAEVRVQREGLGNPR